MANANPRLRGDRLFVAGLRCDELVAPWIIEGAFDTYIRTQLAPSLQCGDVVILDNLNVSPTSRELAKSAAALSPVAFNSERGAASDYHR